MAKNEKADNQIVADVANSKIEAIKNLIFGENIQEYNHEFEALKADLVAKREELLDYVDNTRKELSAAIDNITTDMGMRLSDLEESLNERTTHLEKSKMSTDDMGAILIELGEKIKTK